MADSLWILLLVWLALLSGCPQSASAQGGQELPKLSFIEEQHGEKTFSMVRIAVPTLPDFECEIWCYEDRLGNGTGHPQPDGSLILKHSHEGAQVMSHFVAMPGAVEVRVEVTGDTPEQVQAIKSLNPCWQLRRASNFGHQGNYATDFAHRCFIFTVRGLTLLGDTIRFPHKRYSLDDDRNNPPWIQEYYPIWSRHPGQSATDRGRGTDRAILPIVGCVSRDGEYLTAFAWPRGYSLGQVWHDCLHPRPRLSDQYDPQTNKTASRGKLYFMENDQEKLLEHYFADFGPEPNDLEIAAADAALSVGWTGAPQARLRLHAPSQVGQLPAQHSWQREPWGTWTASSQWEHGKYYGWAHPYADFVALSITVTNDGEQDASLAVAGALEITVGTGEGGLAAALVWENDHGETRLLRAQGDMVEVETTLTVVRAGGSKTLRGRLLLGTDPAAVESQAAALRDEWERATPYRVLPPE